MFHHSAPLFTCFFMLHHKLIDIIMQHKSFNGPQVFGIFQRSSTAGGQAILPLTIIHQKGIHSIHHTKSCILLFTFSFCKHIYAPNDKNLCVVIIAHLNTSYPNTIFVIAYQFCVGTWYTKPVMFSDMWLYLFLTHWSVGDVSVTFSQSFLYVTSRVHLKQFLLNLECRKNRVIIYQYWHR